MGSDDEVVVDEVLVRAAAFVRGLGRLSFLGSLFSYSFSIAPHRYALPPAVQACAANTDACFLKLAGPQLVQMFIGDGAKIVRDAFELAAEKAPTIIFIDELDAIGMKRSGGGELSGVREVQRTMLELLNQLDGFSGNSDVGGRCCAVGWGGGVEIRS